METGSQEEGIPGLLGTKMLVVLSLQLKLKLKKNLPPGCKLWASLCFTDSQRSLLHKAVSPRKQDSIHSSPRRSGTSCPGLHQVLWLGVSAAFVPQCPSSQRLYPAFPGGTPLSAMSAVRPQPDYKTVMTQG